MLALTNLVILTHRPAVDRKFLVYCTSLYEVPGGWQILAACTFWDKLEWLDWCMMSIKKWKDALHRGDIRMENFPCNLTNLNEQDGFVTFFSGPVCFILVISRKSESELAKLAGQLQLSLSSTG